MSTILFSSISSNFFKKSIPLYASISINPLPFRTIPKQKLTIAQYDTQTCSSASFRIVGLANDQTYIPGESPPEIPPEVPRRPNIPDFDPIPPEKPADPLPLSPKPNPPDPIPPKPEAPLPPIPSPTGEPEVVPPHGPDVIPPKPSEPGPTHPSQPDIPPPIMG